MKYIATLVERVPPDVLDPAIDQWLGPIDIVVTLAFAWVKSPVAHVRRAAAECLLPLTAAYDNVLLFVHLPLPTTVVRACVPACMCGQRGALESACGVLYDPP